MDPAGRVADVAVAVQDVQAVGSGHVAGGVEEFDLQDAAHDGPGDLDRTVGADDRVDEGVVGAHGHTALIALLERHPAAGLDHVSDESHLGGVEATEHAQRVVILVRRAQGPVQVVEQLRLLRVEYREGGHGTFAAYRLRVQVGSDQKLLGQPERRCDSSFGYPAEGGRLRQDDAGRSVGPRESRRTGERLVQRGGFGVRGGGGAVGAAVSAGRGEAAADSGDPEPKGSPGSSDGFIATTATATATATPMTVPSLRLRPARPFVPW